MRFGRVASGLVLAAGVLLAPAVGSAPAQAALNSPGPAAAPKLDHVFLVMMENNGYGDIIGNPAAPNINYLARTFGLETDYFGVSPCCSEANYVGLLGGSTHGVNSDDAYWKNTVNAPSLISQLDKAGISWKAYLQSLPYAGYEGICYPAKCNGTPDSDPLYVAKHDTIQNFTTSWNSHDWSRQVPIGDLSSDLRTGDVPRFSYVVPDECHDMHGDPPYCLDSGNAKDPQNQHLVSVGDAYLGHLVSAITSASFWAKGNNAIIVTFDEGSDNAGCCDANPGAGQVVTVVIGSHGVRGVTDSTPANHYSTLSTIQHIFGLGCLAFTCDTAHVKPYTSLFAVTGSEAVATRVRPELGWPTPTPSMPPEPVSLSPSTATAGGWTVQRAQLLGQSDNSLGAIAGSSASDVWAVGNYLPDAASSNTDATLAFAEHYDGHAWTVVRPPNAGVNFNSLYGVAAVAGGPGKSDAVAGKAWAVGEYLDSAYRDRALLEVWDGAKWSIADIPQPGSVRDMLFGAAAVSPSDVWVAGDQEGADGRFQTLAEHWNGHSWSVVPTPDPGSIGNHLYGMYAVSSSDIWAVGQQLGGSFPDNGLVEHWDGHSWSVVSLPRIPGASVLLQGVTANADGQVYAVGEADSTAGGRPLIEYYAHGSWSVVPLPASVGSVWTQLFGVAISGGASWADGTYVDPATDNNVALVLTGTGTSWTVATSPQPGSGSNILGGLAAAGGHLWAAGLYDDGGSRLPLVEHRLSPARMRAWHQSS
ncbi:MAG: hypothetical protein JO345_40290 [Streptosporangiaceae bacterium]|nr:hypothetical protein [Streptosporangiaceae bacterium]